MVIKDDQDDDNNTEFKSYIKNLKQRWLLAFKKTTQNTQKWYVLP